MLATITFTQILELLALIAVVHVVLLAPLMIAVIGAWLERGENQALRDSRLTSRPE